MVLDVAIKKVNILVEYFDKFRETGLSKAIDEAKEISIEMDIDSIFAQKRPVRRIFFLMKIQLMKMAFFQSRRVLNLIIFYILLFKEGILLRQYLNNTKSMKRIFGFCFQKD